MKVITIDKAPNALLQYYKAINPGSKPKNAETLPDLKVVRKGVPIDQNHLAKYSKLCGFGNSDVLPATYPHMLSHPLFMELLNSKGIPFSIARVSTYF